MKLSIQLSLELICKPIMICRKKARKDYTAPINFISGGVKQGGSFEPTKVCRFPSPLMSVVGTERAIALFGW